MSSWDFAGILADIKGQIRGSFGTSDTNLLKDIINRKLDLAALSFPIEELKAPDFYVQTIADYDTGTVTTVNENKTVTFAGATLTYDMKGRKLRINGARPYYTIEDVDTVAGTVILERPWIGTGAAGLSFTMFQNSFDLPLNFNWTKGVFDFTRTFDPLTQKTWDWIEGIDAALTNTGDSWVYARIGVKVLLEPLTGTNTAEAGTSTTTIVDTNLIATDDDFYKDWDLVNVSRNTTRRITGYVASTNTITIESAITGQVVGDTYRLRSKFPQMTFYRRPTAAKNILVKYYKKHEKLFNDYDIPLIPDDFKDWLVASCLEVWYSSEKDPTRFTMYVNLRKDAEFIIKRKYSKKTDRNQKEGSRVESGRVLSFRVQEET